MRAFFAWHPWQQIYFFSDNRSACAEVITDAIWQDIEITFYIQIRLVLYKFDPGSMLSAIMPRHLSTLQGSKAKDLNLKKKAFNKATISCKKVLQKSQFGHISLIGNKFAVYSSGSKAF